MATDKSYAELKDDTAKILSKWAPIFEKCGHLEDLDQKLFLANTLEALRSKAAGATNGDYVLSRDQELNVVNYDGTKRLVVSYDDNGELGVSRQRLDWVND
jgi:hypothetical protein